MFFLKHRPGKIHQHPGWDLEADYLALLCVNLFLTTAPRRIILGGGVMQHRPLFEKIRGRLLEHLNGYINLSSWNSSLSDLIVPAALDSGILGASALAASGAS